MSIIVGSARHDENGKYANGKVGDQLQKSSTNDTVGEVSMQNMYTSSKGWYILRPKSVAYANAIASAMKLACNNPRIGYDQNGRAGIISKGINTTVNTECDCGSLVRAVIIYATGRDVGNFNTANEATILENSGLFNKRVAYVSQVKTPVYNGDVLVTKTKGHTVVVVSGNPRAEVVTTTTTTTTSSIYYTKTQFIKDVQSAIGAKVDGIAGNETLSKTVTVSKYENSKHAVVKPIQKYLNALGYNCGTVDGVAGNKFDSAVKAYQKAKGCTVDGEITAKKTTWKKLLELA